MNNLFNHPNPTDKEYIYFQNLENTHEQKLYILSLWENFKDLADSNFRNRISEDFQSGFWEMYLANIFQENEVQVSSQNSGPDFKISGKNESIWVEAIAPKKGNTKDAILEPEEDDKGMIVPEDRFILRLTSAIDTKFKKYLFWRSNDTISPLDSYIIAINGYNLPHYISDDFPTYILKSVFSIGMHTIKLSSENKIINSGYDYRPKIQKINGECVATNKFLNSDFAGISAIIYSCEGSTHMNIPGKSNFQLLHNPFALRPIPRGWLKIGREFWITDNELKEKNWQFVNED